MPVVLSFEEAIRAARKEAPARGGSVGTSAIDDGPEVQLSVRLPAGLRASLAATAANQGTTVTAFVTGALRRATVEANDSFAGLAADLLDDLRGQLRSAIDDGAYREAAAEVDRDEGWS
ncbi:MAG: hypothetical protein ACRDL8_16580 [Solirubrobacteraceae bacterium]